MTWRLVWGRSRITAVVSSSLTWLVAGSLSPEFVAGYALLGVFVVAGWSTRPVLWWRFGARKVDPAVAETVWRALVPVEWLRGGNQPQLWAGSWVGQDVAASDRHTLVLSDQLLEAVGRRGVADHDLRRFIVRAFATAELNSSRVVAAMEVFCLPWSILADLAGRVCGRVASLPLVGLSWTGRWLFVGLAGIELWNRRHWAGLVMLGLTAVATVTTPRWNRAWAEHQARMADHLEDDSIGPSGTGHTNRSIVPAGRRPSRPASSRGSR